MNKYQKAYERLSSRIYQYADKESVYKDIETLGELVDKATPRKPRPQFLPMSYLPHRCPVCWEKINDRKYKFNYCPNCGQKIDWSEDE